MNLTECADAAIERVLIPEDCIRRRVAELGLQITRDFAGRPLVIMGVLTGAAPFVADLMRAVALPVEVQFVAAASYGDSTVSSGSVELLLAPCTNLAGKHVLLVEDIVDTGRTLSHLLNVVRAGAPAEVACCALLSKRTSRCVEVPVAYRGFEIEDHFVVGYGLDFRGLYRNLPYIGVLRHELARQP